MKFITQNLLQQFDEKFSSSVRNRIAAHAAMNSGIEKISVDIEAVRRNRNIFSLQLQQGEITDQKMTGRCWIFAALNIMRYAVMQKLNLENFEFSQSYPLFYDKLEKSNYFLEAILETVDEPYDGRLLSHLLFSPLNDGGQWDMFCSLVNKYGVVPKDIMPESVSSSKTREMNYYLTSKLREFACYLRELYQKGADIDELRTQKDEMIYEIYKMLCICLGKPPEQFDFELRTKDEKYLRERCITPLKFFEKYVGWNLNEYVSIINAPTKDKPFNKTYTVKYLGNVKEGKPVRYLNLSIAELKSAAIAQLKDNKLVWFGADIDHGLMAQEGIMDPNIYQADIVFDTQFSMTKEQRLDYRHSAMNHAMVLVGVNLDEQGKPDRWYVENSWGKEKGKNGYYVMNDRWFDEYVFQVVVEKKYLPENVATYYDMEPIMLEPWDPIGALADSSF